MGTEVKTPDKPLTAKMLSSALAGTYEERKSEEKVLTIRYKSGERPKVEFSGFWGGLDIKAVLSAIPRAYKVSRRNAIRSASELRRDITRQVRPTAENTGKPEGGSDVGNI